MNVSTGLADNDPLTIQGWVTGLLARVPRWTAPQVVVSDATSKKLTLQHDLGRVPVFYSCTPQAQCVIWATLEDQRTWSETSIQLSCDTASVSVAIAVGTLT